MVNWGNVERTGVEDTHQHGRPFEISLAHQPPHPLIPRRVRNEKAAITHVTTPSRIIRLDVETAQTIGAPVFPLDHILGTLDLAEQHDGAKVGEPVRTKRVERHGVDHRVGVPQLDLAIELVTQVRQQARGHLGGG